MVVLGLVDTISLETVRQALKKRHPALDRPDLVSPAGRQCRVRLADGGRDPDLPIALERYGNTSVGSIPIALDELNRRGSIRREDLLLIAGSGPV
jgi:3-oxoacyl-[acyl-carrier-protein] synthase III